YQPQVSISANSYLQNSPSVASTKQSQYWGILKRSGCHIIHPPRRITVQTNRKIIEKNGEKRGILCNFDNNNISYRQAFQPIATRKIPHQLRGTKQSQE